MSKKVLVTAIGSFSARAVVLQLNSLGYRVVGCDINDAEVLANSRRCCRFYKVPLTANDGKYKVAIKDICMRENINTILPLTDPEVDFYNKEREWFTSNNITVCIPKKETVDLCRDKFCLQEFISGIDGIYGIPTYLGNEFCKKNGVELPIVCKPRDGRSSEGLIKIYTQDEYEANFDVVSSTEYICEPLIEGNIITVDVIRNGAKTICIPREELKRTSNGAGLVVRLFMDDGLASVCAKIADALDIKGCVNFEFIKEKNSGKYYFMECNLRFSGGVAFSAFTGYKVVKNCLKCFDGKKIDSLKKYKEKIIAKEYVETVVSDI